MVIYMTRFKRVFAFLMCLASLMSAVPLSSGADGGPVLKKLTISHVFKETGKSDIPLDKVSISLYLLADMDGNGVLHAKSVFQTYVESILATTDVKKWAEIAGQLDQKLKTGELSAQKISAETDKDGKAVLTDLPCGLYLVTGEKKELGDYVYSLIPSLVTLTNGSDNLHLNTKIQRESNIGEIKVVKVWKDSCHPSRRPKSITIHLLCDGVKTKTVTLPHNGKWTYTFQNLNMSHTWTVTEDRVTGYKNPAIKTKNGVITITNTCNRPSEHHNDKYLPQSGQLWWPVPVLFAAGLLLVIIGLVRRREDEYES